MARGLAPERILEVINELDAAGSDVTVTAVRERLGTGSYSTIGAVLSEWRRLRASAEPAGLPDPPAALRPLLQKVWAEAWKAAHGALQGERQAFCQERAGLTREREEMAAEIERLEAETAKLVGARDHALQALEEGSGRATALELECSKFEQANRLLAAEAERLRADAQRAADALQAWIERATRAEARLEASGRRAEPPPAPERGT